MKFLIAGLGNPGTEYAHTRHNIGFDIADRLAGRHGGIFVSGRYADHAKISLKGRTAHIIKPNTYMNLSGKAVRYWMQELQIDTNNLIVVMDDLALPFGQIRIKGSGSDAGHNGLKSIAEALQVTTYPRLRFGLGNDYPKGAQVHFVLGKWNENEAPILTALIDKSADAIESFMLAGLALTMNTYNRL